MSLSAAWRTTGAAPPYSFERSWRGFCFVSFDFEARLPGKCVKAASANNQVNVQARLRRQRRGT